MRIAAVRLIKVTSLQVTLKGQTPEGVPKPGLNLLPSNQQVAKATRKFGFGLGDLSHYFTDKKNEPTLHCCHLSAAVFTVSVWTLAHAMANWWPH